MIRTLDIFIDDTTWPASGAPPFPATFSAGKSGWNVPILPTLLLIGQMTTPQLARVSLSEFLAEQAAAAAFLASDDSSFMTASEVAVDGGLAQL